MAFEVVLGADRGRICWVLRRCCGFSGMRCPFAESCRVLGLAGGAVSWLEQRRARCSQPVVPHGGGGGWRMSWQDPAGREELGVREETLSSALPL